MYHPEVPITPDACPPDPFEVAEAYLLGHLSPSDSQAFEDHYIVCTACAQLVEGTNEYITGMKSALQRRLDDIERP